MAAKIQSQIGLMVGEVRRLLDLGREEGWQQQNGALKRGKIIWEIVMFMLRLRSNENVDRYLRESRSTLTSLIETTVLEKCKKK